MTTAGTRVVVSTGKGKMDTDLKKSRWVWRPKGNYLDHVSKDSGSFMLKKVIMLTPKEFSSPNELDHAVVIVDQHATQPDPSPRPSPTIPIPDSILEDSGRNHGDQAKEIYNTLMRTDQEALRRKPNLFINSITKLWIRSGEGGGKTCKAEPTMHKDPSFDDLDDIVDDAIDYMESEDAQDEGRTSFVVLEEKEST
ncbi:hypothetical protein Tco_1125473 [Tanacetum coccineum]|uniref:Uncharacterized protein n=1 Tax=Tanacetum coccineum TaxID=301880 RepID=A0ABQ5JC45_9ASTR